MELQEWTQLYLKNQDLLKREIQEISTTSTGLRVKKKDKEEFWRVQDDLDVSDTGVTGIVCLNTKVNVQVLAKSWSQIKSQAMRIVFANPKTNERWVLVPSHHARIADEKSIKDGFQALYSSIASA